MLSTLPGPALRERTTLKLGGTCLAELVVEEPRDLESLPGALAACGGEPLVLGRGSNILAREGDLPLTVVSTRIMDGPQAVRQDAMCNCDEAVRVRCGAGVKLPVLLDWCAKVGLAGLDGLAGIPGTVGGAAAMNAGSYGTTFGDHLNRVRIFTEQHGLAWFGPVDLELGYRRFAVKGLAPGALWAVAEVELALVPGDPEAIREAMRGHMAQKKATQPVTEASAGCVFKNPEGASAGKLMDEAGLKGFALGGMMFSTLHANFMINAGGGTGSEALELIDLARERVRQRFGHELETEVRIVPCA